MNKRLLKILLIASILVCTSTHFCCNRSFAQSDEVTTASDLIEDWDSGTPPANWPQCGGESWRQWTPQDFDCEWGKSELSTSIYHSAPRSLHVIRPAGDPGVVSLFYEFPTPQTKVHVRMYVYFGASFVNAHGFASEEEYIHFLFFDTAVAGVNFGIDIVNYTDYPPATWPPLCLDDLALYFVFHSYHNTPGGQEKEDCYGPSQLGDCWDIKAHLQEWHCYEFMWDIGNNKVAMWIDGVKRVERTMYASNWTNIQRIILSGWNSCSSCTRDMHDFYVDDIAISNRYIGPLVSSDTDNTPPDSPKNLRINSVE